MVNIATSSSSSASPHSQSWLFDSDASHHATSNLSALQSFTNYGGLDEIFLCDGKGLPISHTSHTHLHTASTPLILSNVLCVSALCKMFLLLDPRMCIFLLPWLLLIFFFLFLIMFFHLLPRFLLLLVLQILLYLVRFLSLLRLNFLPHLLVFHLLPLLFRILSRPKCFYKPNSKFVNLSTKHPFLSSLELSTISQAMENPLWHNYG